MRDYYSILNVSTNASGEEIKQAFRKLALLYHPDKNPSASAVERFREIHEAYQVLSDPLKKTMYDQMLREDPVSAHVPRPRRKRSGPTPTGAHGEVRYKDPERERQLAFMRENVHYAVAASRFTLVVSLFLALDLFLPPERVEHRIVEADIMFDASGRVKMENGKVYKMTEEQARAMARNQGQVYLYSSAWLGIPLSMENERTNYKTRVWGTIYGNFLFAPVILLITSCLGVFWRKGFELRFNMGAVNFFMLLLTLALVVVNFI
ncbi:MAG: J domain-containing protein [Cyclobacteriaceae bacterium]